MYINKYIYIANFHFDDLTVATLAALAPPIMVEVVSATSIQVSWDRLDIPEITGYIVYYSQTRNSEMATTVLHSKNSVIIENLLTNAEYQFQVVAVAALDGDVVMGERSNMSIARPTAPPANTPHTIETQG